jgi:hypothetical protein
MTRRILFAAFLSVAAAAVGVLAAPAPKLVICHIPPGNPANAHSIDVSQNSIPAHRAHGDCFISGTPDGTLESWQPPLAGCAATACPNVSTSN